MKIKENDFVSMEQVIEAGWVKEHEGMLGGSKRFRFEVWVSPNEELTCTFYYGEMTALVERAE